VRCGAPVARGHTSSVSTGLVGVVMAAWLSLAVLTATGASRRGQRRSVALAAGLFFPVTWVVWYLIDERRLAGRTVRPTEDRERAPRDQRC
jgi:hypothetical protein